MWVSTNSFTTFVYTVCKTMHTHFLTSFLAPLILYTDAYLFLLAEFYERDDLNRYLAVLPTDLACDIILWTYAIEEDPTEDFYFSVDLDLGTFCNNGGSEHTNLVWEANEHVDVYNAVASRDIAAGEEVLCDYESGAGDEDDGEE